MKTYDTLDEAMKSVNASMFTVTNGRRDGDFAATLERFDQESRKFRTVATMSHTNGSYTVYPVPADYKPKRR